MKITVNKKHFDAALAAGAKDIASTCLLAQAVREAFPGKKLAVTYGLVKVGRKRFEMPKKATTLMGRFDTIVYTLLPDATAKRRMTKLRGSLPVTFEIKEA